MAKDTISDHIIAGKLGMVRSTQDKIKSASRGRYY